jgi:TonB family protein
MNAPLWLCNLGVYSLQAALIAAAAAALAALFRPRAPRAMLLYWHGVLALALLLPAIQPWQHPQLPAATVTVIEGPSYIPGQPQPEPAASISNAAPRAHASIDSYRAIAWLLALGVAVRLAWLGVGLVRLTLYRRRARPLDPVPEAIGRAMLRTAACADLYISEDFDSPITFGALSPAVLLPARLLRFEPALQEAIATHELLHVRRHDWLWVLGEELVRAALWFHPAVWWLLGRIQLSREQAVDAETIELTEGRQHYLEALLEIAKLRRPVAALAPLFLKKRHFTQRVKLIVKEVSMSRSRLILTFFLMIAALVPAAGFVVQTFPLQGAPVPAPLPPPAPTPASALVAQPAPLPPPPAATAVPAPAPAPPAAPRQGAPAPPAPAAPPQDQQAPLPPQRIKVGGNIQQANLINKVMPMYPPEATAAGIQGNVQVDALIGTDGAIKRINAIAGPPMLVSAAEGAVRQWKYRTTLLNGIPVEVSTQTSVNFTLPDSTVSPQTVSRIALLSVPYPEYPARLQGSGIEGLVRFKVFVASNGTVRDLHYLDGEGALIAAAEAAARQARFLPPGPGMEQEGEIGLAVAPDLKPGVIQFAMSVPGTASPNTPFPSAPAAEGIPRITVAPQVQSALLIDKPEAVYPPLAQQARIQGTVLYKVLIGTDGMAKEMRLMMGHPLLAPAAMDAVRLYRYQPTFVAGKAAEVITYVQVNFSLP